MAITSYCERRGGPRGRPTALFRAGRLLATAVFLLAAMAAASDTRANGVALSAHAQQTVVSAALKTTVPPELALAVARVGGVRWSHAEDGRAAAGIMGIRPSLARAEFGIGPYQLRETRANAGVGVALLERLHGQHGKRWDLALSHYRGGPLGRCGNEAVVHMHTIDYVADVMDWWRRYQDDETISTLIGDVRQGRFQRNRFTVDDNTFLRAGRDAVGYDERRSPLRGAHRNWSGGDWVAVTGGAGRFR